MSSDNIFHLNVKTGTVGRCRAEKGNCPFGGQESHFTTIAEARVAYENSMEGETFAKAKGLSDYNKTARNSSSPAEQLEAVENGSQHTLKSLASNKNADPEALVRAKGLAEGPVLKAALVANKNFPVENLEPEDMAAATLTSDFRRLQEIAKSDHLTDSHIDQAGPNLLKGFHAIDVVGNINNKISTEKIIAIAESDNNLLREAVKSGRYPSRGRFENLSSSQYQVLAKVEIDPVVLDKLYDVAQANNDRTLTFSVLQNNNVSEDTLERAANTLDGKETDFLMSVYRNPNVNRQAQEAAMQKNSAVNSLDRVRVLDQKHGGKLGEVIGNGHEEGSYNSQERRVRLNPAKVKELGMTVSDVDAYIRWHKGNYLFGANYDENTGIYRGYID